MTPTVENDLPDQASFERWLARLLVAGLACAVLLLLTGVTLVAFGRGHDGLHATSVGALPGLLGRGEAAGFLDLGLLVLLAVPVLRVFCLLAAFARRREWWFALCSLLILLVLATGVVVGMKTW